MSYRRSRSNRHRASPESGCLALRNERMGKLCRLASLNPETSLRPCEDPRDSTCMDVNHALLLWNAEGRPIRIPRRREKAGGQTLPEVRRLERRRSHTIRQEGRAGTRTGLLAHAASSWAPLLERLVTARSPRGRVSSHLSRRRVFPRHGPGPAATYRRSSAAPIRRRGRIARNRRGGCRIGAR
jgi:hypothetical protein